MKITIRHLSLPKIAESGQCFRVEHMDGWYRFISAENVLYIKKISPFTYELSCNEDEWKSFWYDYFDLDRDYEKTVDLFLSSDHPRIREMVESGSGIRILRQEPWETIISFIISQNKNIPAIRRSIKCLCDKFGHDILTPYETVKSFPSTNELKEASIEDLRACGVGYRDKYILDAVRRVLSGEIDLEQLPKLNNTELRKKLKTIDGIGDKVADCVALYAFSRTDIAPVDVWIKRSIEEDFGGENIYQRFSDNAGLLQQYVFYHKTVVERS